MWRKYYQPLPQGETKGDSDALERPEPGVCVQLKLIATTTDI
jgi:hypothetical protein